MDEIVQKNAIKLNPVNEKMEKKDSTFLEDLHFEYGMDIL